MIKFGKVVFVYILVLVAFNSIAQKDRKYLRQGNKEFEIGNFADSEIAYRKAADLEKKKTHEPSFNIGDALYKQEKYEDAINQFNSIADLEISKDEKAKVYHNMGNSLLQSNKLKESVEAFKNALRNNPKDKETKYNLAYAQKKLEEQQKQQDQDKDNKDQNKDQDKKDQDKQDQDQDKQDQEKDQDKKDQDKSDQEEKQQQPQISKEDAERILQALANDEKDTQKKVKEQQAAVAKVKVEKEW